MPLRKRIQQVAAMAPMWMALNACCDDGQSGPTICNQREGISPYQSHFIVQREPPDRKDFAYRDQYVAHEECLDFPAKRVSLLSCSHVLHAAYAGLTDLRPTAARFLSERSSSSTDAAMAAPHTSMDPGNVSAAEHAVREGGLGIAHEGGGELRGSSRTQVGQVSAAR